MFKRANENFIIPDNAVLLTEEEMMEVEGGGFKDNKKNSRIYCKLYNCKRC
ncbi:hypothetical protein [Lachnotalea glycerini]|uniref:hypothetical protein n=1 Tax=Lachnotalea glycerini TaxID=1763509 RepID=UPI0015F25C2C|nr:hypothetical protein [Lachnotalea glycerini]